MPHIIHNNTVRSCLLSVLTLWISSSLISCNTIDPDLAPQPNADQLASYDQAVALDWAQLQLQLTKTTAGFGPPVAARAYALAGLTMYESLIPATTDHVSMAGQLNALNELPKPQSNQTYNWAVCLVAGQADILRNLYAATSVANLTRIDSLEQATTRRYAARSSADELTRSVSFGRAVAAAIFAWSKTDGGHEAYKSLYPASYDLPATPGCWRPTESGQAIPMLPYWGNTRPLLTADANLEIIPPPAYSTDASSPYYAQYLEVYMKNKTLTEAEKQMAVWWADNPGATFTPAGHSYNIARLAAITTKAPLMKTVEGLCRVGLAVHDAFIACWKCKYKFHNERPYTYVRQTIDAEWKPFWPAPPFPGYISGHATQSMAMAEVLTALYGPAVSFTDDSHVGRSPEFGTIPFQARSYRSFYESAEESALSRFLGGIHTRQDNEMGLQHGQKVGRNINALHFTR
jgi:hypothetical protein